MPAFHHRERPAMIRTRRFVPALLALPALLTPVPAFADPAPMTIVQRVLDAAGSVPFTGVRLHHLVRQNLTLDATMRIFHQDGQNYRVTIQEPSGLSGVNLWVQQNRAHVYFPAESLLFRNDNPSGSREAAATMMGQVTTQPGLLQRNYALRLLGPEEAGDTTVALTPCHVLEAEPIRGYLTPAHRFWISKDSYQIMREERTWGRGLAPYFTSGYSEYFPSGKVDTSVPLPAKVSTVALQQDLSNRYVLYRTVAEAETALGAPVPQPAFLPAGFQLDHLEFATFFGTRIALLHYTDGLNWLFVSYRPKPNLFLTLMAGAMALGLVDKLSQLTYQSPFNYHGAEVDGQIAFAYGDCYPEDLQRVVASLKLSAPSP